MSDDPLPLPARRCLTKERAAAYLGIGTTLLAESRVPRVKRGRRCLYDALTWIRGLGVRGRMQLSVTSQQRQTFVALET
jgi:hypothetical protein